MRHFTINLVMNAIGAGLFFIMGISLFVGFALNASIVEELQQAANFDQWKLFILSAAIVSLLTAGVFIFGTWKVTVTTLNMVQEVALAAGKRNSAVAETNYILGLNSGGESELLVTPHLSVILLPSSSFPAPQVSSRASSIISIFGFGHDGEGKWTFAGHRAAPKEEPERSVSTSEVAMVEKRGSSSTV